MPYYTTVGVWSVFPPEHVNKIPSKLYRAKIHQLLSSQDYLIKWTLFLKNNSIILTCIPSDIGIQGNERAYRAAKKALQTCIFNTKISYTDLKPLINKLILKKWQKSWDDQTQNKLHHIQDTIGEWPAGYRRNRKEEVIISRLCISHTSSSSSSCRVASTDIPDPLSPRLPIIHCLWQVFRVTSHIIT